MGAGVREVSYRLMFIACSAQSAGARDGMVNIRGDDDEKTPEEVRARFAHFACLLLAFFAVVCCLHFFAAVVGLAARTL